MDREDRPDLRQAIRSLMEEERRALADHPSPDDLVDYQAGDVTGEERERIQDHLALCPDCVRVVLDLEAFADVATLPPGERLTERDVAAEWERFAERVSPVSRIPIRPPAPAWSLPRYARAAVLAFALLGTGILIGRVGSGRPPSMQIVELFPAGAVRGSDAVAIEPWAESLLLNLSLPEGHPEGEHEAALVTKDGREVWRRGGLHGSDGNLPILIPRDLLSTGAYRIRLYGPAPTRPLVAEYALRLRG